MESNLNVKLISRSLNFHGQQLQKSWESELGDNLSKINVPDPNYSVYQQRQKQLSFQDRGKRLKLHDFIVKNSSILFDNHLQRKDENVEVRGRLVDPTYFAVLPPYETFLKIDPEIRTKRFLELLKPGDIIIATITSKNSGGIVLKVLCSDGEVVHCVSDMNVRAFMPLSKLIPATGINASRINGQFMVGDSICSEVLDVFPESEKLICGLKGEFCTTEQKAKLGFIKTEDFPEVYKKFQEPLTESYSNILHKSVGFFNPSCTNNLSNAIGLGSKHFSHFPQLKNRIPVCEYASELRQVQAGKWAYRSVADGIEFFKAGKHSEAFQCLNKALQIDPRNIEGLVARGALYANSGSFKKAIDDFEAALKLNPGHQNAQKYLGETLVAFGRSYEEENKYEDALKCYENCLTIMPYHEEAQNSVEYLKKNHLGFGGKKLDPDLPFPQITPTKALEVKDTLKQLLGEQETKEKSSKKKKKDKKARKPRHSSSSSSSSSSDSSSSDSSSSSSSSSDTSQESARRKKKKRNEKKEHSLSPLSKRMATMDSVVADLGGMLSQNSSHYNPPQEASKTSTSVSIPSESPLYNQRALDKESDYEQRVRKFLEQTKGDDDYEEKVRKFLDETAKWKKDQKLREEKAKKKKKKEKKSRDKAKKKKRDEKEKKKKKSKDQDEKKPKRKQKNASKQSGSDDDVPSLLANKPELSKLLGLSKLPDLEQFQKNLTAYYTKLEKEVTNVVKKKEAEKRTSSSSSSKQSKSKPPPSPSPPPKRDYERTQPDNSFNGKSRSEKRKPDRSSSPAPRPKERSKTPPQKFKMQFNAGSSWNKKKDKDKDIWSDSKEKRYITMSDEESVKTDLKKIDSPPPKKMTLMDKLGGFRMNAPSNSKNEDKPPPKQMRKRAFSRSRSSGSSRQSFSRSRSRSRQRRKYSRSRSHSSSRSRSGSYPNRSRRFHSRSRSRSHSRSFSRSFSGSRSASRSRSPDYYRSRGARYQRGGRGTYYRPRPFGGRGGYIRGRGRNNYFQHRDFDYRGRGNYRRPRGRGRGPRYSSYRPRSRDRDYRDHRDNYRSRRSRSYDDDDESEEDRNVTEDDGVDDRSPMTKVDEAKERINKMILGQEDLEAKSGEEKDSGERKNLDGKWGDDDRGAGSN